MDEILQQQDQGESETPPETAEMVETESNSTEESQVKEEETTTTDEEEVKTEEVPQVPPNDDEINELRQFYH